jgi:hypothetical protein
MINKKTAFKLAKKFNINLDVVPFTEWHIGLNIELEHGKKYNKYSKKYNLNITNNNHKKTASIVIAHLLEDPRYYYFLHNQETQRDKYWKNKIKPNIFNT